MHNFKVGLDLGGSKIEIIVLSALGEILLRERIPTPSAQDFPNPIHQYTHIVAAISDLIAQSEQQLQCAFQHIGIGIPGAISPATGLVKNANTTCLIGQYFQQDLEHALQKTVSIANDADCFVLSEAKDGAAKNASSVFGVIIGTGCGGGLVINQHLVSGPNAICGEWGHNPLPWPQDDEILRPCYCGKSGCIETFLSGPGFSQYAAQYALDHFSATDNQRINSQTLSAKQWHQLFINKTSAAHSALAAQVFERYARQLAKSLATVINVLDPDVIVLGGGMSNIDYLYQRLPQILPEYVFSDQVLTQIVKAEHGDSSGVRGAAWLIKSSAHNGN